VLGVSHTAVYRTWYDPVSRCGHRARTAPLWCILSRFAAVPLALLSVRRALLRRGLADDQGSKREAFPLLRKDKVHAQIIEFMQLVGNALLRRRACGQGGLDMRHHHRQAL